MSASQPRFDIFQSCRLGDLDRVRYLVEQKEVNVNVRDQWDSTPLYYACLCGHLELVEYLLDNGARCDASTFDGERCIYGALTDQIRKLLLDHSVLTSRQKRREPYEEFLRRLLESGSRSDVTFRVHSANLLAHKCILLARSDYFRKQFEGRWRKRNEISISHALVDSEAFQLLLEWLYCAQVKIQIDLIEDLERLCIQCNLPDFKEQIDDAVKKANSFVNTKRGARIKHILVETFESHEVLQRDLGLLCESGFPQEFRNSSIKNELTECDCYHDLVFLVDECRFRVHQVIFSSRSDYFGALIADHFNEALWNQKEHIPEIRLREVRARVFAEVARHVYSNEQKLDFDIVYEVLEAADMFLLPTLKRQCGNFLASALTIETTVGLVHTARLFDLPRLEQQCTEFMARNIEKIIDDPDFRNLVVKDAEAIKDRHETDTIDIVDEIRFFVKTDLRSLSALEDTQHKLELLDEMLVELGFDI